MRPYDPRGGTVYIGLIAAMLLLPTAGCGGVKLPPRAKVSGTVTLNGQPLTTGTVTFMPDASRQTDGPTANGGIDANGHYELSTEKPGKRDGAVVGFHKVRVIAKDPGDSMRPGIRSLIPAKYNNETSSGLTFEVKADTDNKYDIALTGK